MGSAVNEDDLRVDKLSLVQNGEVSGHENVSTRRLVRERTCVSNEDVDPQYKLLLENLKRYGGSYALEVVGDDGVSELIRYHQEDGLARRVVRRRVSDEDVDPQYKLFLENLRGYGGSYALEVVGDDGVSELIRYHQEDGLARRVVRRRVSDEDVDPQYELFLESLREDGNSYAFEVDREDGVSEVIRYHKDGFQRRIKRRCISDEDVDPQCKLFLENLREDGNSYALKVAWGEEEICL
ncbi:uncharacterized protein LOC126784210 [Argentina anserina]|uniref:uncharacterized protein LOC126784210 n=1 Tax=Argentina anserina TaxID=57926 RepID=UPI0021769158|nr:uncharacterized protein LOC126784210 [Potentilla anserina]